jgi:hypothetical protein
MVGSSAASPETDALDTAEKIAYTVQELLIAFTP